MQTIYLNIKTSQGVETVDEFTRGEDAPKNPKEFKAYIKSMISEYQLTGQNVYKSTRSTKEWKNKN
jgi:hypothetical protein